MRIPSFIAVSDFRQDVAAVLKRLQDAPEPLIVTQRGRAIAVIQNLEAYEKAVHERELLLLLAMGEKELAVGEGRGLSSVLAEAEALLVEEIQ